MPKFSVLKAHHGFTFIELAFVMLVVGSLIAGAVLVLKPMIAYFRYVETVEKMNKISHRLDAYAVINYRLPCPAQPTRAAAPERYGYEAGSTATLSVIPDACPIREGIIPFRTLNIPENLAIDGYGNYLTYAVSPAFAQNTLSPTLPAVTVHPACRTKDWFYDGNETIVAGQMVGRLQNLNPRKAQFCCPGTPAETTDIHVLDEDGNNVLPVLRNAGLNGYQTPGTLMRPVDESGALLTDTTSKAYYIAPQVPPATERATAVAYILVSHGQNGFGAFNPGTGARNALPATISAQERENADTPYNGIYYDTKTFSTNQVTSFDDLVLWRTQDMIFAEEGQSCSMP